MKQALIVLGMHRSGTSAVAGTLSQLGICFGSKLYRPQPEVNEKGFFEHADIVDVNDEALLAIGSSWDDILPLPEHGWTESRLQTLTHKLRRYLRRDVADGILWGLKDPRLCRLLPWWLELLDQEGINARYLLTVRHPLEVADSLRQRDGFSQGKSIILWIEHNLASEYWTRNQIRTTIEFEALLSDPTATLTRVEQELELMFPRPPHRQLADIQQFLADDLRHHRHHPTTDNAPHPNPLLELAEHLYQCLRSLAGTPRQDAVFDALAAEFENKRFADTDTLVEHLRLVTRDRSEQQRLIRQIFRSHAWQLGKPLRFLERFLGGEA